MSPQFEEYASSYWAVYGQRGQRGVMSSGFQALALAMHLCGHVSVFGMGQEVSGEYYSKVGPRCQF